MIKTRGSHFKGEYSSMLPPYADPTKAGVNIKGVKEANNKDELVGLNPGPKTKPYTLHPTPYTLN
jgi:hypothetical protein